MGHIGTQNTNDACVENLKTAKGRIKQWITHNPLLYYKKKEPDYARGEWNNGIMFDFKENPNGNVYWKRNGPPFYSIRAYEITNFHLSILRIISFIKGLKHIPHKIFIILMCLYTRNKKLYIKKGYKKKVDGKEIFIESYFKGRLLLTNRRYVNGKWEECNERCFEFYRYYY